jgi:hypothetical protein
MIRSPYTKARQVPPVQFRAISSASISEGYPREFFLQPLSLSRVPGLSKPIHERKEAFLLGFLGLKAGLNQIDEYAIGACLPSLGQSAYTPGNTGGD